MPHHIDMITHVWPLINQSLAQAERVDNTQVEPPTFLKQRDRAGPGPRETLTIALSPCYVVERA